MTPVIGGATNATNTSTSDLVIQPASQCVTLAATSRGKRWKGRASSHFLGQLLSKIEMAEMQMQLPRSLPKQRLELMVVKGHDLIPGLGVMANFHVIASGAFGHEIATSLTSFTVAIRALQVVPP